MAGAAPHHGNVGPVRLARVETEAGTRLVRKQTVFAAMIATGAVFLAAGLPLDRQPIGGGAAFVLVGFVELVSWPAADTGAEIK